MSMKRKSIKPGKKKVSRIQHKIGKAPGSITYLGARAGAERTIDIIEYDAEDFMVVSPETLAEIKVHKDSESTSWINIVGLSDEAFVAELGEQFKLSSLLLEDAINTLQRPKLDEYESYIFVVFKMLYIDKDNKLVNEHAAMVLMENTVLFFQELRDDVFDTVRTRLKTKSGRIRTRKADYLFFALLDAVIDNYFVVLEYLGQKIDILEEGVFNDPKPQMANNIQQLKKEVMKVRRCIYPVKEMVNKLIDTENPLITRDTKLFLRDAMDHSIEINESLEIYREMSMSLMEMYMSTISNKMNEVMKVLTIMASIFIPLTFIAGIYGMNFEHMPELQWEFGYFVVWGIMILLFIGMIVYFKRKNWI